MGGEGENTETGVPRCGVFVCSIGTSNVHPPANSSEAVIPLAQHMLVSLDFRHCVIACGKISAFNPPLSSNTRCPLGPSPQTPANQRLRDVSDLAFSPIRQRTFESVSRTREARDLRDINPYTSPLTSPTNHMGSTRKVCRLPSCVKPHEG